MAEDKKKLLPLSLPQNPSSTLEEGQEFQKSTRAETENILADFFRRIPDNYFSEVIGPFYTQQFQAAAEVLAKIQIVSQEVFEDSDYDFTRPEYLFQILGDYLFPDGTRDGIPTIEGDVSYRSFLQALVLLILRGAGFDVIKEAVELLTKAEVTVIEKFLGDRGSQSGKALREQFGFEVFVSKISEDYSSPGFADNFPENPFVAQENVKVVLQALKPAHTNYEYSHLFLDSFLEPSQGVYLPDPSPPAEYDEAAVDIIQDLFQDTYEWVLRNYYYEDFRKFCTGAKAITGSFGETLTDRRLFRDVTRSFISISSGSFLTISSGTNSGSYRVEEVIYFPLGDDSISRPYVTSPSGLTGTAVVSGSVISDPLQDFSSAVEGEVLEFISGSNQGFYRLSSLLGPSGGPIGSSGLGSFYQVRISPTILRLKERMPAILSGQTYSVTVDRLGILTPRVVVGEDVSSFFVL